MAVTVTLADPCDTPATSRVSPDTDTVAVAGSEDSAP